MRQASRFKSWANTNNLPIHIQESKVLFSDEIYILVTAEYENYIEHKNSEFQMSHIYGFIQIVL